jgi:TetR/AcrR family transcriptional regulator
MQIQSTIQADAPQSAGQKAILDAAARLFSEQGYDGVSMRQIAEAARVSKANIYHHFQSKAALYLAILRSSADRLSALVENLAEGKGPFDRRLREFARAHLEHLFENATTVRLVLREAFSGDEQKARVLVEQVLGGIFDRLITIFREGQQAGFLRQDLDPGLCAQLVMGNDLFYFQSIGVLRQIPEATFANDRDGYSTEMMNVILNGMLAPADSQGATA